MMASISSGIRSHSDVPVIIIADDDLDETDRIMGLELGADDYIIKPFSLREVLARVRATSLNVSI